jgi:hypothetical protein
MDGKIALVGDGLRGLGMSIKEPLQVAKTLGFLKNI